MPTLWRSILLVLALVRHLKGYRMHIGPSVTSGQWGVVQRYALPRPRISNRLTRIAIAARMDESPSMAGSLGVLDDSPSIVDSFSNVQNRIQSAFRKLVYFSHPDNTGELTTRFVMPRLVAVSKTHPTKVLREAYDAGCRDFGENFVQELIDKAADMPKDVRWRFVGALQSNKAKKLVHSVRSLACIETVASSKLADKLQAAVASLDPPRDMPLDVMIQVNTSPWEGTKGGVSMEETPELAAYIVNECPELRLVGLMTIGAPGNHSCFDVLAECRASVASQIGVEADALELSMGMSGDFEAAILKGSTSVRVGSLIFGNRQYPSKS